MNKILICDSREKKNKHILDYFEKNNQDYIISKLDSGDYMYYKDYSTIIDKKDSLLEICGNLCHTSEHSRVVREVELAQSLGCKNFIFLVQCNVKSEEDIKKWKSPHTKVKGETLLKIMQTMKKKYGVRFIFCEKKNMGEMIIQLLGGNANGEPNEHI